MELLSPLSLFGPGAWPLPSLPKEKAFSQQVGAGTGSGTGTVDPHPTLNPRFLLGPQSWNRCGPSGNRASQGFPEAGRGARTDFRHECSFLESEDLRPHREFSMSPPGFLGLSLCPAVSRAPLPLLPRPFPSSPFLLFPGPCRWASARWVLTHRASARGRIRSQTLRLVPCAPRKFAPARSFLSQLQKLFTWRPGFLSAGEPGWGDRPEFYGCKLWETLQTSANTRGWRCVSSPRLELGFFFFPLYYQRPAHQTRVSPPASGPCPNSVVFIIVRIQARMCLRV